MYIKNVLLSLILITLTLGCKNNTTSGDSAEYTQLQYYNSVNLPYKNLYIYFSSEEIVATADDSGFANQSKVKVYPFGTVDATLTLFQSSLKTCYAIDTPIPMIGSVIYISATQTDGTVCILFPNDNDFSQLESIWNDVLLNGDNNLSYSTRTKIQ